MAYADEATEIVWTSSDRMSGAPCFVGTRIRVQDLFDWLADGSSIDDFLATYPQVSRDKVVRLLRLAETDLIQHLAAA